MDWSPPDRLITYAIGLRTRFRGIEVREGLVWEGPAGWAEWSPFLDYDGPELVPWLLAAREAAEQGWPQPVRDRIEVNCTVPALPPDEAYALVLRSGCRTAKVKVAESGQKPVEDQARVEAVRAALGPGGRVRVDANGGWSLEQALSAIRGLAGYDLEYVEQPCRTIEELAELRAELRRRGLQVLIAADESIRRSEDPYRVAELAAADIAVLKVQPLGGVRACLQIAERIGLPVVVSSALETSIGLRAGLALAAALPELPYACGLNTAEMLTDDLVQEPSRAREGFIEVPRSLRPAQDCASTGSGEVASGSEIVVDPEAVRRCAAGPGRAAFWQARLMRTVRESARRG